MGILLDFPEPIDLAVFREHYKRTGGSNFQCKVIVELCTQLAKSRGWDLDALTAEATVKLDEDYKQQEREAAVRELNRANEEKERRRRNYIKKYGHPPPEV